MNNEFCPCCGRRCPLDNLRCERGKEYVKTGIIPSQEKCTDKVHHNHHRHEHKHLHMGGGHHS